MNFTSQLVQDVFHQQYHQNDNISSTKNKNIHSTWESRISDKNDIPLLDPERISVLVYTVNLKNSGILFADLPFKHQ